MPQVEEKHQRNKSGSVSTAFTSLAALGSVIVASSCCLPLLPFVFAAWSGGYIGLCGQAAAVPARRIGLAHRVWLL